MAESNKNICSFLYELNGYDSREIVIPVFEVKTQTPCTAILDLTTWSWSKLPFDGPYNINENSQYFITNDESKENVFLFGGLNRDSEGKVTEYNYTIQRLDAEGWHKLDSNITLPIEYQPAVIPLDFYWNNNLPKIDISKMPQKSKHNKQRRYLISILLLYI